MSPTEHIEAWERVKLKEREGDMKLGLLLREAYGEIETLRATIARHEETGDKVFPVFEILDRLLKHGYYFDFQDELLWLFDPKGESVTCGETFTKLAVNLALMGL